MSTNITQFSPDVGLPFGTDQKVMTYLYGLSDFWRFIFEDSSTVNAMLEAGAMQASEIYNHFLQLSSIISLEGIQDLTRTQIKLILISSSDLVAGTPALYNLPSSPIVTSARYVSNQPLLPTISLEAEVHYHIDPVGNTIQFYKPLSSLGLPSRVLSDGSTEYSLWFVDALIDEQLVSKYYGNLIKITPETSSKNFTNFIYGLYYLYTQGPTITNIQQGFNLVLGIPFSRGVEQVIDIRLYSGTNEYLVTTDQNSYLIPYGITPSVVVGQTLQPFQELAQWVQVTDYWSGGDWWIDFMIPDTLIPNPAEGYANNRATPGSPADYIMRNYLYKNTFLVQINTTSFKDLQLFTQLSDVIQRVRPTYTYPVYVWVVPLPEETLTTGDQFTLEGVNTLSDRAESDIQRFRRDSSEPYSRAGSGFIRFSAPAWMNRQVGLSGADNGTGVFFNGSTITSFTGNILQYQSIVDSYQTGWLKSVLVEGTDNYRLQSGNYDFSAQHSWSGLNEGSTVKTNPIYPGFRTIFLYTTTVADLPNRQLYLDQMVSIGPDWYVTPAGQPGLLLIDSDLINADLIDACRIFGDEYTFLTTNFSTLFNRGNVVSLPGYYPENSYASLTVVSSDILYGDFLLVKLLGDGYGASIYWVTTNTSFAGRPYISNSDIDTLNLTLSGEMSRGMGVIGGPMFLLRGAGTVGTQAPRAINSFAINGGSPITNPVSHVYSDSLNNNITLNRSGVNITLQAFF